MQVDNPVHELKADKADRKYNPRVLVDVGRTNAKDGLQVPVVGAGEGGELGKVWVARGRQALVPSVQVDEGGCGGRGSRLGALAADRWRQVLTTMGLVRLVALAD